MPFANGWALSATMLQEHKSKLHPVILRGRVLRDAEMNYHPTEKEFLALLLLLKTCHTMLAGKRIRVYTIFSMMAWLNKSKTVFRRVTQFAVLLAPWDFVVERVPEKDVGFAQLLQLTVKSFVDLEPTLAPVPPPSRGSATARMDPALLYAHLPCDSERFVLSYDGSAKKEIHGYCGSCSWFLWRHPEWKKVIPASAFLASTTVIVAEYTGMSGGMTAAVKHVIDDLVTPQKSSATLGSRSSNP